MLPIENRLRQEKDIKNLFKRSKGVRGRFVAIRFGKNDRDQSRFAFIAGVKVSKKAVVRNRVRRQLRASVHSILDRLKKGFDVAILIQKQAVGQTQADLENDLFETLKKAKLL